MLECLGNEPTHFILIFDNGYFSEFGTFSITDWIGHAPKSLLAKNFGLPESAFDGFPSEEVYFARGAIPPEQIPENLQGPRVAPPQTHKFRMLSEAPHGVFKGGREWRVDSTRFPISTTITGVILDLEPGALRELHWHPNADEWQYVIEGDVSVTMFGVARPFPDGTPARRRRRLHPAGLRTFNRERRQRAEPDTDRIQQRDLRIDRSFRPGLPAIRWTFSRQILTNLNH